MRAIKIIIKVIVALYACTALFGGLYQMAFGAWGWSFGGVFWTLLTSFGTLALYRAIREDYRNH